MELTEKQVNFLATCGEFKIRLRHAGYSVAGIVLAELITDENPLKRREMRVNLARQFINNTDNMVNKYASSTAYALRKNLVWPAGKEDTQEAAAELAWDIDAALIQGALLEYVDPIAGWDAISEEHKAANS